GQPAFSGASIPEVVFKVVYEQPVALTTLSTTVSSGIAAVVAQAMAKDANKRFPNVGEFIEALTGQPFSQFKMKKVPLPDGPLAAGTRPSRDDAFAATVGSGDHKDSVPVL